MSNKLTKFWYLEQFNLAKKLSRSEMMNMAENMEMRSIKKNQSVLFPDEAGKFVYFLKKGVIKIGSFTADGQEDYKYLVQEGQIFGELALVGKENPNDMAIAVEDSMICLVDVETMQKMMITNRSLNNSIFKIMGFRIRKLERRLEAILFKDAKTRILEFLIEHLKDFGVQEGDKIRVKNYLTHRDIAKLTSTSRQTVNAVFSELRKANLIHYDKNIIEVEPKNLIPIENHHQINQ